MFNPVNQKKNFPEMEHEVLKFWDDNKIFEKSVKQREGEKKFVFFDGPPFANGLPHYGHILANVLKDAVVRYFAMKGYYIPRTNGWDCHGLPVEYEIEKELKISGRKQIEQYGIEKFNDDCRASVFRYTKQWEETLKRIGRWVDFEHSYATLNMPYMESIWWIFKQIWDKGMVYEGHKSMHICPRCETALSNFEVTQGYKDVIDSSLVVKFKSDEEDNTYYLAWTTTPWCLPGQIAVIVHPDKVYAKVESEGEYYWIIENRVEAILKDRPYKVIEKKKGKELEGKSYEPLFPYNANKKKDSKWAFKILVDEFVTDEDGSGFVTSSPDFGEDDMRVCAKYEVPFTNTVDMSGVYREHVTDYAGESVLIANRKILEDLKNAGKALWTEPYKHSYPHCWRCDTPLLNYATKSLFIRVTDIKKDLIKNNKKIHWQPEHIGPGRFGKWLEDARDWAISRNRYWGSPIPVWECECGEKTCVGSVEELKKLSGGKVPMRNGVVDLHKPYIDEIEIKCPKCGKNAKRISDVLDCWFESGSMPYAQLHYPFENKKEFEDNFPAQFIAEGLDQTRGWFYTLHILAGILFDAPAFKNVIVNGILLAANGEKLSKRKKNYPDPNELFENKGVDAVRFFLLNSVAVLADDVRFSERHVDEILKQFLLILWNTYSFFVMYANIDNFQPKEVDLKIKPKNLLDRWILSELNTLVAEVAVAMDDYNLSKACRPVIGFVDNLSNWYIRRSRRRFWKSENDADKIEAYSTLYTVLVTFSKLIAPFTPFAADEMYKNLTNGVVGAKESVHLEDWPKFDKKLIDKDLNEQMKVVRTIVNLGLAGRSNAGIKVRQPLSKIQVAQPHSIDKKLIAMYGDIILEELNVKALEFITEVGGDIKQTVAVNSRAIGPKYGSDTQKIIDACKRFEFKIQDNGKLEVAGFTLDADEFVIGYTGSGEVDVESADGITVILDSHITPELTSEGYARDIVRFIQEMRKKANYNVNDRIYVFAGCEDAAIKQAIVDFADYIKKETLAIELQDKGEFAWDASESVDLDGKSVKISIRK
ncbi:MAG: isoleucyl-tRNA synthetase, isoleucyl-tRNA synthetase [Candidatus Peregrinibacteria bacterium GW2011_GWC2_39_14]|nr:MAG: isoleucyl-tRNA synthetase, isoleucyl-tRNA synthetase [Candidatus Peregrinibacteria bacterium GW2011_GWC2_39_14]